MKSKSLRHRFVVVAVVHIQIWPTFCKSTSAHEVKIVSTSVHGCSGGAIGDDGGADVDGVSDGIKTFQMFSQGGCLTMFKFPSAVVKVLIIIP